MVTLTPSNAVGSLPATISSARHVRPGMVFARFVPSMVTHEPASIPGWKLAPFTTLEITGVAAGSPPA